MFLINSVYWKLALVSPDFPLLKRGSGEYSIGACDNLTRTIYINNTLHGGLLKKVLCHEIVHAAMFSQLSTDITEMVKDASQEEKATLREKMTMLANKIM